MVEFLEPFLSKIVDDICPTAFCLSDDHCIGVLYRLLWQDSRMNSTENDFGPPLSKHIG